jgi:hypothetical protein
MLVRGQTVNSCNMYRGVCNSVRDRIDGAQDASGGGAISLE